MEEEEGKRTWPEGRNSPDKLGRNERRISLLLFLTSSDPGGGKESNKDLLHSGLLLPLFSLFSLTGEGNLFFLFLRV